MNAQEIIAKKNHGDSVPIMQIANKLLRERGLKEYTKSTIRQQLNGTRAMKPAVLEAANMYYNMVE